ncbi:MAG: hypothetical protein J2P17_16730 [Mycobacterium sp.]|nr:hypothetical protein [Mycobacterium sp.]
MGQSDRLREAAQIARKGAGDISAVQRSVLYKVDDAHQAGFVVGEDLSVTDGTRTSRNAAELAARQAQAQAYSADIRSRAGQLVATDTEVGTNLTGTAGDVSTLPFDEQPITLDGQPYRVTADPRNGIQHVSHGFKTDEPGSPPSPTSQPDPPAIKLPPRTTMNTSPPIAMSPGPDPSKHDCGPGEIFIDTTESVGGAAGIASGVTGEVPTAGGTSAIVIGGLSALLDGMNKLSQCR